MAAIVNVNGRISPPEQAVVSVFDRGFLFGDGVYETGRAYHRCPLFLEEHLERLRRSAGRLYIELPWTDDFLKKRLFETLQAFGQDDCYFRVIVTRGLIEKVGLDQEPTGEPTLVVLAQSLPDVEGLYRTGVSLMTSSVVRNSSDAQDPNIKTSNYLNSLLALKDAKRRGGQDAVMCDRNGNVTEGTTFSIFCVTEDGVLRTSSLEVGILDSITRRHVLAIGQQLGIPVEEGFFPLKDFLGAPEAFIASSVREVIPVAKWDETEFPVPGPVTARLHDGFKAEVNRYLESHSKF